jgi:hypothetical protein
VVIWHRETKDIYDRPIRTLRGCRVRAPRFFHAYAREEWELAYRQVLGTPPEQSEWVDFCGRVESKYAPNLDSHSCGELFSILVCRPTLASPDVAALDGRRA